jgi:hypothetical protein
MSMMPPTTGNFNYPYATNPMPMLNPYASRRGPYDDPFRAIQTDW